MAGELGVYVLLSSIGFESFDDNILINLNKGLSVEKNIEAIRLIRQLKEEFPHQLGYSTGEGANHGFIHPTPWDTKESAAALKKKIYLYGLQTESSNQPVVERLLDVELPALSTHQGDGRSDHDYGERQYLDHAFHAMEMVFAYQLQQDEDKGTNLTVA